ncbi:hypothetical protein Trydic_g679 [Trypoxylus dichotomus]
MAQKREALRLASPYRTILETAALLIAGIVPINFLAKERTDIYLNKREAGSLTRQKAREHDSGKNDRMRTLKVDEQPVPSPRTRTATAMMPVIYSFNS